MKEVFYRIGELAEKCGVSIRTIRYYEEFGLLKAKRLTRGGQHTYTNSDFVYIKRIKELQLLGFSLEEIKKIIQLKDDDEKGEARRDELLNQYRAKLDEAVEKKKKLEQYIAELKWHINQLSSVQDFQSCPGTLCKECEYKHHCQVCLKTED